MAAKRALIVDDSRSARAFLSSILAKYDIGVETAESAEQAIEHLATHRPDVIFMDHMMPGMDGFQAVQLIKNNPRTATIPIMMYTSQEGEVYLGQARALGAVGVLPKQIQPADVSKVLYQLRLMPDRRTQSQSSFRPANEAAISASAGTASAADAAVRAFGQPAPAAAPHAQAVPSLRELRELVEAAVHEQMIDLRHFLALSLDEHAARSAGEMRALLQELPKPPPHAVPGRTNPWPWLLASAALIVGIGFAVLWSRELAAHRAAEARLGQTMASAAAAKTVGAIDRSATPITAPSAAPEKAAPVAVAASASATPTVVTEPVPYGEVPLAGGRIEVLRGALARATSQGFRGLVDVRLYSGRFCLVGNAVDGYALAPDDTPISKCDVLGNPRDDNVPIAQRQSVDFANLVGGVRQATRNAIDVRVAVGEPASLAKPYPPAADKPTAADWNRIAAANNRVEIRLRPDR
jgi:CheY-like chemotaxis protein